MRPAIAAARARRDFDLLCEWLAGRRTPGLERGGSALSNTLLREAESKNQSSCLQETVIDSIFSNAKSLVRSRTGCANGIAV